MTTEAKRAANAESKRNERARKKALGLRRIDLWAPPALHDKIKTFVRNLLTRCTQDKVDKE